MKTVEVMAPALGRSGIVQVTSPAPRDRWRELLADSVSALPEHDPAWTDALCASGRYADVSRLYSFAVGRQVVLPLVARRGLAGVGGWAASYPAAWGIGGPIDTGLPTEAVRAVLRDLRGLGLQRVALRPNPLDGPVWAEAAREEGILTVPRRAHVLDLSAGLDAVWAGLSKSARRNVRQARRSGVRVEVARGGRLLDEYYTLFLASVDRWSERLHEPRTLARARARHRDPLDKLRTLGTHLGDQFCVILVYDGDVPVAGSIVICGRTAHSARSAMDKARMGNTHAGVLANWSEIEVACAAGCSTLHMGESGRSKQLAFAKEKWGARPYDYVELRIERLPWTQADTALRTAVKRVIGFRDD